MSRFVGVRAREYIPEEGEATNSFKDRASRTRVTTLASYLRNANYLLKHDAGLRASPTKAASYT